MDGFPPAFGVGERPDPPLLTLTAFEELSTYLTNPHCYNRIRRIYSPFPVLSPIFHAYLSVSSVDVYLQDLERLAQQRDISIPQLRSLIRTTNQQMRHYLSHASQQMLTGLTHPTSIRPLIGAISTRRLCPNHTVMENLYMYFPHHLEH